MRAKKVCNLCILEDTDDKDKLWGARDLHDHQAERMYHTPAMRFERYLDKAFAGYVTALKADETRGCPFSDKCKLTIKGYNRISMLVLHIAKKHFEEVPGPSHQLYLRQRVFQYWPTFAERREAGWLYDRFKAVWDRGKPFLPRADAIDRIVADENEKGRNDEAAMGILLGTVADDQSWTSGSGSGIPNMVPRPVWPDEADDEAWDVDMNDASIWEHDMNETIG